MTWKEDSVLSQKQKFITLLESGRHSMASLCRDFGISRRAGYDLKDLYEEHGWEALEGRSRAHKSHPMATKDEVIERILHYKSKREYRNWGGPKIRDLLFQDFKKSEIPSGTTVQAILKRNGLVKERRPRRTRIIPTNDEFHAEKPNEIWDIDFKGDALLGNKERCYPLTVADNKTRNILVIKALPRPRTEGVIPVFDRVFKEFGLPEMIHSDNGPPFGSPNGLRRMTRLAVWFMERGITPVYSDPGCPQQNGKLERMHRTLKADTMRPMAKTMGAQQNRFNRFREVYNEQRPHEALDMKKPSQLYKPSKRIYDGTVYDWEYGKGVKPRMVSSNGAVRWKKHGWVRASTALIGRMVGLMEIEDGLWELYYRHVLLGYFDERTMTTYEIEELSI